MPRPPATPTVTHGRAHPAQCSLQPEAEKSLQLQAGPNLAHPGDCLGPAPSRGVPPPAAAPLDPVELRYPLPPPSFSSSGPAGTARPLTRLGCMANPGHRPQRAGSTAHHPRPAAAGGAVNPGPH